MANKRVESKRQTKAPWQAKHETDILNEGLEARLGKHMQTLARWAMMDHDALDKGEGADSPVDRGLLFRIENKFCFAIAFGRL